MSLDRDIIVGEGTGRQRTFHLDAIDDRIDSLSSSLDLAGLPEYDDRTVMQATDDLGRKYDVHFHKTRDGFSLGIFKSNQKIATYYVFQDEDRKRALELFSQDPDIFVSDRVYFGEVKVNRLYAGQGLAGLLSNIASYLLQYSDSVHVASFPESSRRLAGHYREIGYTEVVRKPRGIMESRLDPSDLARVRVSVDYNRLALFKDYRAHRG